jgi:hypothetical protein
VDWEFFEQCKMQEFLASQRQEKISCIHRIGEHFRHISVPTTQPPQNQTKITTAAIKEQ